ncbi:MAG: NAD-dependent deacylase [Sedimentisphaerales bacterium]|nr:NAD-dependent deacylase [Sedimentisphaerales bacterium]
MKDSTRDYATEIARVAEMLASSGSVLFVTGAGISADSGLPTYRGIGGLYNTNATEEGMPIERVLSGDVMEQRPELTWKYLAQIERACRDARHNRAHEVVAEIEGRFERVWTLTQNVDGFHRAAGARNVIDIHGDLHDLCCLRCSYRSTVQDYSGLSFPPRCPQCQDTLRPDVVLFGEMLPEDKVQALYEQLSAGFDIVFTIGTTSVFPYIAEPVRLAAQAGRPTVEINPDTTGVSHLVDVKLPLRAAAALQAIWDRYQQHTAS